MTPIIAALSRQTIEDLWSEYRDELIAMEVSPLRRLTTLVWDARFSLITALLAGFGRAAAEVGAVIIVGGNIEGFTRTMTTAIALETSKGNLPLAIGLGLVLIAIAEMIGAKSGLGYMIWTAWETFSVEQMYVGLFMIAIIGFVLTVALNEIERVIVPWKRD